MGPPGPPGPPGPRGAAGKVSWLHLEDVQFEPSSVALSERCHDKIGKIATWLHEHPTVAVRLVGSADEAAREDREVAVRRVEAVHAALIARGVERARIQAASVNEGPVVCKASTEECQLKTRRVEVQMSQRY